MSRRSQVPEVVLGYPNNLEFKVNAVLKQRSSLSKFTCCHVEIGVAALGRRHHRFGSRGAPQVAVGSGHGEAVAVGLVPHADTSALYVLKRGYG